jgi:hypothetical protein
VDPVALLAVSGNTSRSADQNPRAPSPTASTASDARSARLRQCVTRASSTNPVGRRRPPTGLNPARRHRLPKSAARRKASLAGDGSGHTLGGNRLLPATATGANTSPEHETTDESLLGSRLKEAA